MPRAELHEAISAHGRLTISTHTWRDDYDGLSPAEILALLTEPDETSVNDNIFCTAGLNQLVSALNWSGIEDQNVNMGSPFTPSFLAPIWGAVGTGSTAVTSSDTILTTEAERAYVAAGGTTGGSASNNPAVQWLFLIPVPLVSTVIAEAGVFVIASAVAGSGLLLDHSLISPTVTQGTSQLCTLSASFTWGNG